MRVITINGTNYNVTTRQLSPAGWEATAALDDGTRVASVRGQSFGQVVIAVVRSVKERAYATTMESVPT